MQVPAKPELQAWLQVVPDVPQPPTALAGREAEVSGFSPSVVLAHLGSAGGPFLFLPQDLLF